jgi:8-amino-3,8-dideoxy-alpha-D-manno-octulosonate transaminase
MTYAPNVRRRAPQLAVDGGTPVRVAPYDTSKGLSLWGAEEEAAVLDVMRSRSPFRYYGPQPLGMCDRFEALLRGLTKAEHALAVSSGTAALTVALVGMGIPPGAEVIVPAVTFVGSANAVVWARGVPVFAEVDDSLMLDPASLEACISERTFAVMPVHLGNVAADMDPIRAVADRAGVRVLEDAAQALGVTYHGRRVGTIGDAGAFSFQVDKNVAAGEGGAVVSNDPSLHRRSVRFHDQGGQFTTSGGAVRRDGDPDDEPFTGVNLRMTEIAAAICAVQITRVDAMLGRLRTMARAILGELADLPVSWRRLPDPEGSAGDLTVMLDSRLMARRFLAVIRAEGIPARTMYDGQPVYATPALRNRRSPWGVEWERVKRCRVSEQHVGRSVTLELGPTMSDGDVEDLIAAVRKVAAVVLADA